MKVIVAATVLFVVAGAGPASAQTADFKCPAAGTQFAYRSPRSVPWWAPALSQSVRSSFPDWRQPGKDIVLERVSVKAAEK